MPWRLGFDIGGTFTDLAIEDSRGRVLVGKQLTTPRDPAVAVFAGLAELLERAGTTAADLAQAVHGTTLGANLVIERKGARTFLLTTAGFRDVLEIQRQLRYNINDLFVDKHPPLIPRNQILEVAERVRADGTVHRALDEDGARAALAAARENGVESLAIALLHAYANPAHEERLAALAAELLPGVPVTRSSAIAPQYREYERTNTAVVNAYVAPAFRAYLAALADGLAARGFRRALYLMQNTGGIASVATAARVPVRSLDSGPAAGTILAAHIGALTSHPDLVAFDMGGTTAKASLVEQGRPLTTDRLEVDMIAMRPGSGLPINVPSVDLVEIGAGGGSIARVERGILGVGPASAGADPGPACYGLGGTEPTVTDANVVLGYLDPAYFLGGARVLDVDAAATAIERAVAKPLGLTIVEAAWGIHRLVTVGMEGAIRVVSIGRGKDPRDLACVTFGGAGPIHGARLGRSLGLRRLIAPFAAGVGSAIGLLLADARFDLARTLVVPLDGAPWDRINRVLDELEAEGAAALRETGLEGTWHLTRSVEVRYAGQGHDLAVPLTAGRLDAASLDAIRRAHASVYAAHYGYAEPIGAPLEATNWKVEMLCVTPKPDLTRAGGSTRAADARKRDRRVYVAEAGGFVDCAVYDRYALGAGAELAGPAIVEERETTVMLLPGDHGQVDRYGNLVIDLGTETA
ncbi:MAG: hydantoinase/oxoprolinase family protein [Candidatus Rokubacteria bacterium]|nr:hydantoinase/oxoprolinase family protein [Candidatus Rokubacteria bacterium]